MTVHQKVEGQAVQSNWYAAGPPCASTARTEGRMLQTLRCRSAGTPQILLTEVGTYTQSSITSDNHITHCFSVSIVIVQVQT